MTAEEFEARIVAWARGRTDVEALVLAGSRGGQVGRVDGWSDWDFHLICRQPARYQGTDWLAGISPVWCAHAETTPRGVIKVSAVFENGFEVDFVPLAAWQMKLVYWAMGHPDWAGRMPRRLRQGVVETRTFLLGSGFRLLLGDRGWERRLGRLAVPWPEYPMEAAVFLSHCASFWQKSVWVSKKIARPEPRSAMHWLHRLVTEHVYALLAEEARQSGRPARSEARKAEAWLDGRRLEQTAMATSVDQQVLSRAFLAQIALFEEVSQSVARSRGFVLPDYQPVAGWLRSEMSRLA